MEPMKVVISGQDLDFLDGGELVVARFPIKVMVAAAQRVDLLRAVPRYDQIPRWKALRYEETGRHAGSVSVIDSWRMDVRGPNDNEEPTDISVLRIRDTRK